MKPLLMSSNAKRNYAAVVTAIACSMLLALPGCLIPKLRQADPGECLPFTFNGVTTADNSAQLPIAEFFNDPRLTNLVDQALVSNQQLKILAEEIQIANNEIRRRRGAYLPFVNFLGSAGIEQPSDYTPAGSVDNQLVTPLGGPFPSPLPDFLVAADITWQIDIWRQLRNARDAARLRFLASNDGRNYVVTRLAAEIAENYYTLMALDKRLENLDTVIALQEKSLEIAIARKAAARGTELGVQRFQAEVRKNQSEKLIIYQRIVEVENRINYLTGRYPQQVDRVSAQFLDLNLRTLAVGVPAQLLMNRPDIREAERELEASGLDVRVARANFYPKLSIGAGVGYEAFNAKYIFFPESLIYNVAGNLVAPLINKSAIRADYMNANARQLQAVYDYQRTILNAFIEVINSISKVHNYTNSIAIKRQQLQSLEASVDVASNLFQNARIEYIDVLFAQRDLLDARMVLIDTKKEQLAAVVNAYQALGGGWQATPQVMPAGIVFQGPWPPAAIQGPEPAIGCPPCLPPSAFQGPQPVFLEGPAMPPPAGETVSPPPVLVAPLPQPN